MVFKRKGGWWGLAQSNENPSLYILNLFCHALISEDSLVNTSHLISEEIITVFEGGR